MRTDKNFLPSVPLCGAITAITPHRRTLVILGDFLQIIIFTIPSACYDISIQQKPKERVHNALEHHCSLFEAIVQTLFTTSCHEDLQIKLIFSHNNDNICYNNLNIYHNNHNINHNHRKKLHAAEC